MFLDWFYAILAYLGLMQKEANILFLGPDNTGKTILLHMLKDERLVQHQPSRFQLQRLIYGARRDALNFRRYKFAPTVRKGYYDQMLVENQLPRFLTVEEFSIGNIKFKAFFLDGYQITRRFLRDYYAQVDAVVYVVDASDWVDFRDVKADLDAVRDDESLANVPFLILGDQFSVNDVYGDLPPDGICAFMLGPRWAASEDKLLRYLALRDFTTGKGEVNPLEPNIRPLEVFMCSIVDKEGYGEGFKWMSQYIK